MNRDEFVQHSREHLLKGKKTPTRVSDSPNKLIIGGNTKTLNSQKVEHESGHIGVIWFRHLIVSSRTRCRFQHVLLHLED